MSKLLGGPVMVSPDLTCSRVFIRFGNKITTIDLTDIEAMGKIDDDSLRAFLKSRGLS